MAKRGRGVGQQSKEDKGKNGERVVGKVKVLDVEVTGAGSQALVMMRLPCHFCKIFWMNDPIKTNELYNELLENTTGTVGIEAS